MLVFTSCHPALQLPICFIIKGWVVNIFDSGEVGLDNEKQNGNINSFQAEFQYIHKAHVNLYWPFILGVNIKYMFFLFYMGT